MRLHRRQEQYDHQDMPWIDVLKTHSCKPCYIEEEQERIRHRLLDRLHRKHIGTLEYDGTALWDEYLCDTSTVSAY